MILQVVDKQQTGRNVFFLFGKPMGKHGKRTTTWRSAFGCKTMGFLRSIPPTPGFQSPPRTIPFLGTGIPINKPFILKGFPSQHAAGSTLPTWVASASVDVEDQELRVQVSGRWCLEDGP